MLIRQPGLDASLALQVARMVGMLRKEDLRKVPGVAETLDWAATLAGLGVEDMRQEPEIVHDTLIAILKTREDRARVTPGDDAAAARQGGVMDARRARLATKPGPGPAMRRRLAGFAHTLRGAGFAIGHAEVAGRGAAAGDAARPIGPSGLRAALQALFCSRHSDLARFDELFDAFWRGRGAKRGDADHGAGPGCPLAAAVRGRARRRATRPADLPRDGATPRLRKTAPPRAGAARAGLRRTSRCRAKDIAQARRDEGIAPRRSCSPSGSPARCARG